MQCTQWGFYLFIFGCDCTSSSYIDAYWIHVMILIFKVFIIFFEWMKLSTLNGLIQGIQASIVVKNYHTLVLVMTLRYYKLFTDSSAAGQLSHSCRLLQVGDNPGNNELWRLTTLWKHITHRSREATLDYMRSRTFLLHLCTLITSGCSCHGDISVVPPISPPPLHLLVET